jgi:putative SOS response-associated peptidase YedK
MVYFLVSTFIRSDPYQRGVIMCGRYSLVSVEKIVERFLVKANGFRPRYNIAPSQQAPVILSESPDQLSVCRWGLVPHWAKDEKIGYRMINARSETLDQKPAFRMPFRSHRCLVLADSFYQWKESPDGKTPYRIMRKDEMPFAFAGIYDTWKSPQGDIRTFSIATVESNSLIKDIHDRMPAMLLSEHERAWLEEDNTEILKSMLQPYPENEMKFYEISTLINSPRNNSEEVIQPVTHSTSQVRS